MATYLWFSQEKTSTQGGGEEKTNGTDLGAKGFASVGELAGIGGRHILSLAAAPPGPGAEPKPQILLQSTPPHPPPMLLTIPHFYHSSSPPCSSSCFGYHSVSRFEPLSGKSFRNWQKSSLFSTSSCASFSGHSDRNWPPFRFVIRDVLFGQKSDVF